MRIRGQNCHLGRVLQRVGCHRTLWAQWCQQTREIMAETWAENPESVLKSAHSCALWTAALGFFPVSLRPAAPSYLESPVLQSAAKAVKRPPSKRRRKSHPLLFHKPIVKHLPADYCCSGQGRLTEQDTEKTFWTNGNVLLLVSGNGFTGIYNCKSLRN